MFEEEVIELRGRKSHHATGGSHRPAAFRKQAFSLGEATFGEVLVKGFAGFLHEALGEGGARHKHRTRHAFESQ